MSCATRIRIWKSIVSFLQGVDIVESHWRAVGLWYQLVGVNQTGIVPNSAAQRRWSLGHLCARGVSDSKWDEGCCHALLLSQCTHRTWYKICPSTFLSTRKCTLFSRQNPLAFPGLPWRAMKTLLVSPTCFYRVQQGSEPETQWWSLKVRQSH